MSSGAATSRVRESQEALGWRDALLTPKATRATASRAAASVDLRVAILKV